MCGGFFRLIGVRPGMSRMLGAFFRMWLTVTAILVVFGGVLFALARIMRWLSGAP